MPKEFRKPRPGEVPTGGADDELLDDPPRLPQTWSLQAYAAGSRVRRIVFGSLLLGTVGAGITGYWYVGYLQDQRNTVVPIYDVDPASVDAQSRILYWSDGPARLGLFRDAPGVRVIVLPDRIIQLADGYAHAQIKVEVRDGKTIKLAVLTGRVTQQERTTPQEAEGSPPTHPATAP